jgi:hypothetical protein
MCSYNPAQPPLTYFSVGDAVAALAFTLAVQQLFKPIYLFRLRAHGLKVRDLIIAIFLGALCAMIAALLPNLPLSEAGPLRYPIVWELLGGALISGAYAITAFISLRPARVSAFNMIAFSRAGAALLSAADDEDRARLAEDLLQERNIERLVKTASAWELAEMHGVAIEFERLRSIGAPQEIRGRVPISAFYIFSHRKQLERASYAASFLRIMADPDFCSLLVRKCAWITAATLGILSKGNLHSEAVTPFVQGIGYRAILQEESMMTKEVGYTGFATAPLLSQNLFENWHILSRHDPLGGLEFRLPETPTAGFIRRLNSASEMILKTAIKHQDYWPQRYALSMQAAYQGLFRQWGNARSRSESPTFAFDLNMGVNRLTRILVEGLSNLSWDRRKALFVIDAEQRFRIDLVDAVADILYSSLECLASDFAGVQDNAWFHAITVFTDVFPSYGAIEPEGMNPLQQQLALKLLDKLSYNMNGLYPPLSRVLLAIIGPYKNFAHTEKRTAYILLKDAVYAQLRKLPELYAKAPEKVADFLPLGVQYDPETNTLTHTDRSGGRIVTELSNLPLPEVNLTDDGNWQKA